MSSSGTREGWFAAWTSSEMSFIPINRSRALILTVMREVVSVSIVVSLMERNLSSSLLTFCSKLWACFVVLILTRPFSCLTEPHLYVGVVLRQ